MEKEAKELDIEAVEKLIKCVKCKGAFNKHSEVIVENKSKLK